MKRRRFLLLLAVAVAAAISIVAFEKARPQTATTYEDAGGWVYQCSKPVRVKDQGATYASGKPSLTPINQSEAEKYCHKVGIE